eukprot:scaffold59694_cov31-Tisochrysis_lutea.AAC.2
MTASRPPGLMSRAALVKMLSSSFISRFTSILRAWKTRAVLFVSSFGGAADADRTTCESCTVVVSGRAATIARASMREERSSPCFQSTSAISEASHSLSMVAAVKAPSPLLLSMRMSRGPSKRNEKPRSASSI